ncbi:MAG: hypothetical protein Q9184_007507 [Pyrenodesmia sp. 2 TL-2023]
MSQQRWDEYKELAAYVATPVNRNSFTKPAETPAPAIGESAATPDDEAQHAQSVLAADHEENGITQQADEKTFAAHNSQAASTNNVTLANRTPITATNLPCAGPTTPSSNGLSNEALDPRLASRVAETPFHLGLFDPSSVSDDPRALAPRFYGEPPAPSEQSGAHPSTPLAEVPCGDDLDDFLDAMFAANVLQSMHTSSEPLIIGNTPDVPSTAPTTSNPLERPSPNPFTTVLANTASPSSNTPPATPTLEFDFDPFIGAPNLVHESCDASTIGCTSSPITSMDYDFDPFISAPYVINDTVDPAVLGYPNSSNNMTSLGTPMAGDGDQQNTNNIAPSSMIPKCFSGNNKPPFIFGNTTTNQPLDFAPSVNLPPTPFNTPVTTRKRKRSLSDPASPLRRYDPLAPTPPRSTPTPTPTPILPPSPPSLPRSLDLNTRLTNFVSESGITFGFLRDVLIDVWTHPPMEGMVAKYALEDGGVLGVASGDEVSMWVE